MKHPMFFIALLRGDQDDVMAIEKLYGFESKPVRDLYLSEGCRGMVALSDAVAIEALKYHTPVWGGWQTPNVNESHIKV